MASNTSVILQEKKLLKALIIKPENIDKISEDIFISKSATNLYNSVKELALQNVNLSVDNIAIEVGKIDSSFNEVKIKTLLETELHDGDFPYLVKSLKESKLKYNIRENLLRGLLSETSSKDDLDLQKLVKLRDSLDSELTLLEDESDVIKKPEDILDKYIETLHKRNTGELSYDTGDHYLNEHITEGFAPKYITTIFGASGVGKSAFTLGLINKQINKRIPCLYVTLEMTDISTFDRLISQRNGLPLKELHPNVRKDEQIQDYVFELLEREKEKFKKLNKCRFIDKDKLSIAQLESLIKQTKIELGVDYLIVTVDLMTMLTDFNVSNNKANDYEHAMNKLHSMARRQNIHLIGVVQSKRPSDKVVIKEVEDVEKFRPSIEQIKNSSAIEARSRIVLSVFRPRHYVKSLLPDCAELEIMEDTCEIGILKQNQGELSRLRYLFMPETFSFYKYVEPEDDDVVLE